MTKTQELLENVREIMGGQTVTDYRIAKELEIHGQAMKRMKEGTQPADAYICTRLALILERDPLEVIAEVEADRATTPERKRFWASFISGLMRHTLGGVLLAIGVSFAPGQTVKANDATTHNGRFRQRQRPERRRSTGLFAYDRRAA